MAIAHVCMHCGRDLALLRPRPDPPDGLALVFCAGCGRAACRVVHPIWQQWRALRRGARAAGWLLLKILIATVVALLTFTTIDDLTPPFPRTRLGWFTVAASAIAAALANGVWVTAGLRNFTWRTAWAGWCCTLGGAGLVIVMNDMAWKDGDWGRRTLVAIEAFEEAVALGFVLLASVAGIPLGRCLLAVHSVVRRDRLRHRRRRRRTERAGR
jgi:hypothetical protein